MLLEFKGKLLLSFQLLLFSWDFPALRQNMDKVELITGNVIFQGLQSSPKVAV